MEVKYREHGGKTLCMECLETKLIDELKDPSTSEKRFKLNLITSAYELDKVSISCKDCNKKMWVKVDEQWKKQCLTCYKATRKTDSNKHIQLQEKLKQLMNR